MPYFCAKDVERREIILYFGWNDGRILTDNVALQKSPFVCVDLGWLEKPEFRYRVADNEAIYVIIASIFALSVTGWGS